MFYTKDSVSNSSVMVILIILLISIFIMVIYTGYIRPFSEKRKYIKMEMSRTRHDRHMMWKRELKKLYVSQIPILGKFLSRYM